MMGEKIKSCHFGEEVALGKSFTQFDMPCLYGDDCSLKCGGR